jgi:HK97 gp10 family phage protein
MTLDFDALYQAVVQGAAEGLSKGAQIVARRARQRAPVRNIFGHSYKMRAKTGAELTADFKAVPTSAIKAMSEGGTGHFTQRWMGPKRVGDPTDLDTAMEHLALYEANDNTPLTRHGAYEVRSGRADFGSGESVTVGGRLRGEISASPAAMSGDGAEAWVISPTPYAKYMEFGTRHNRAHPYLRPALEESRQDIVTAVRRGVARASKKGLGHVEVELALRL